MEDNELQDQIDSSDVDSGSDDVDELDSDLSSDVDGSGSETDEQDGNEAPNYEELYGEVASTLNNVLKENENLKAVLGRQGNELGDLRKDKNGDSGEQDLSEFFDKPTLNMIEKVAERIADKRLADYTAQQESKSLEQQVKDLSGVYDLNRDNLSALGYFADANGVSLADAAGKLSQMGLLNKKNGVSAETRVDDVKLDNAPRKTKVSGSNGNKGKVKLQSLDVDEYAKIPKAERMKYLRGLGG